MEKRRRFFIVTLSLSLIAIAILLFLFFQNREFMRGGEEVITDEVQKLKEEEQKLEEGESTLQERPVEVFRHGWRVVERTMPKEAYIWEWAVEVENKTNLYLVVFIKYVIFDGEGKILAEAIGGEELNPKERKIIVGRAVAEKILQNARRSELQMKVSPSRKKNSPEEIIENWKWKEPYEIDKM
ncbi:hypothetical protein HRbin19_00952 [bacterium HR19]|nr:hypothetical protein HRbin19_00952 [bacterium HR19]